MKNNSATAVEALKVQAGFHAYGYWVEATVPGGQEVKREDYGNSPFESTAVFALKSGGTLELTKLRENAIRTAQAQAEELGVAAQDVSVFHDTDEEENIRLELGDVPEELLCAESMA